MHKQTIMNTIIKSFFLFFLAAGIYGCSKMDATYKEFLKDSDALYPGKVDSVQVFPGRERIKFNVLLSSDPKVKKLKVFWAGRQESVEFPVSPDELGHRKELMVAPIPEGDHTFYIITYDGNDNPSVSTEVFSAVYGTSYQSALLSRPVTSAITDGAGTLNIQLGAADISNGAHATEIIYTDTTGNTVTRRLEAAENNTVLDDYQTESIFKYRTLYLPASTAIDTFYTAYDTVVKVIDLSKTPVDLLRSGWTATASSFDDRPGGYRPPQNTLDGDVSTMWHSQVVPQMTYPHWIMVDMGSVQNGIDGIFLLAQVRNETAKTINVLISDDNVSWTFMGTFPVQNIATQQYFDFFPGDQHFRYFKVIAAEPTGSTSNTVIVEIGAFTRDN